MKSDFYPSVPRYVRPTLKFIKIQAAACLAGSGISQDYEEEDIFGE